MPVKGINRPSRTGTLLRRHSTRKSAGSVVHFAAAIYSRRIKEEFDNGKHYYALQGQKIELPDRVGQRPDPSLLAWHNENCFRG
jgi:hypothetical protein